MTRCRPAGRVDGHGVGRARLEQAGWPQPPCASRRSPAGLAASVTATDLSVPRSRVTLIGSPGRTPVAWSAGTTSSTAGLGWRGRRLGRGRGRAACLPARPRRRLAEVAPRRCCTRWPAARRPAARRPSAPHPLRADRLDPHVEVRHPSRFCTGVVGVRPLGPLTWT